MCNGQNGNNKKGDEDMATTKEQMSNKQNKKLNRQELRKKFIQETIKENRVALEKLSRT